MEIKTTTTKFENLIFQNSKPATKKTLKHVAQTSNYFE